MPGEFRYWQQLALLYTKGKKQMPVAVMHKEKKRMW